MPRWIVAAALMAAACGKHQDPAACRVEAHELATMLGSFDHTAPMYVGKATLVSRSDLPEVAPTYTPSVEVLADRVSMDGDEAGGPSTLEERLRTARAKIDDELQRPPYPGREAPDPTLVALQIDAAAPWSEVVWVAEAAVAAGFTRAAIVFARPAEAVTMPPRSSIDGELDRIFDDVAANDKAVQLARLMSKVVAPCPAMTRAFGAVAAESADKAQVLIDAIEPALVACNCSLDVAALRSAMFRLLYVPHPTTTLTVALAADGRAVVQPAATTWQAANALVTAGAPLHLTVAP